MFFIGAVSLALSDIPLHVVLLILAGPCWQVDRLQAIRGYNIGHDNIKFTCLRIVVLNGDFSLWLGTSNNRLC